MVNPRKMNQSITGFFHKSILTLRQCSFMQIPKAVWFTDSICGSGKQTNDFNISNKKKTIKSMTYKCSPHPCLVRTDIFVSRKNITHRMVFHGIITFWICVLTRMAAMLNFTKQNKIKQQNFMYYACTIWSRYTF